MQKEVNALKREYERPELVEYEDLKTTGGQVTNDWVDVPF